MPASTCFDHALLPHGAVPCPTALPACPVIASPVVHGAAGHSEVRSRVPVVLVAAREVARRAAISADPPDDAPDEGSIDGEELSIDELRLLQEEPCTDADGSSVFTDHVAIDPGPDASGEDGSVTPEVADAASADGTNSEDASSTHDDYDGEVKKVLMIYADMLIGRSAVVDAVKGVNLIDVDTDSEQFWRPEGRLRLG